MPVDFFAERCCYGPVSLAKFGISDREDGQPAFVDENYRDCWIAVVDNPDKLSLIFTAIDNCIELWRTDGSMDNRCDGMLTSDEHIVFIELKNQRAQWIQAALQQLRATIVRFVENHDISRYRHKRAFACNRRHPHFQVIDHSTKQSFFREFKVRLNIQTTVVFK